MRLALGLAREAGSRGEVPIGAVVVKGGRVVARASNQTEALADATAHAEMLALTMAEALCGKYLDGCSLYVTVEPCIMCAGAIGWTQVKRLVFGAGDPKKGFSRFSPSPLHPRCQVRGGVLEADCQKLMADFFRRRR